MKSSPFEAVRSFEAELAGYCGSKYAVTCTSCTSALLLALAWFKWKRGSSMVRCPRRTYCGVPYSIINAGHKVEFADMDWTGEYRLAPLPVIDSARRFFAGMCRPDEFRCVSFHSSKICGHTDGGAVLCDDAEAVAWMRRVRFDGRTIGVRPSEDVFDTPGFHIYMAPGVAAELHRKLSTLPRDNPDLPNSDYPDLSLAPIFRR
jgi:dTDP-4-amino-4,6-dideoxygalactose transaminase